MRSRGIVQLIKSHLKLKNLFKYLELLSGAYFEGDPLEVKSSINRVTFLIEMEFNDSFQEEEEE